MTQIVQAVYANGVLRPLESLNLPENRQVQIVVVTPEDIDKNDAKEGGVRDPLAGLEVSTGMRDLAENFDDYRLGLRKP